MSGPDPASGSGDGGGIPVPPEVPEQFAAAYRAAYARALAAQSPHPHRRLRREPDEEPDDTDTLPERDEEPVSGTHRDVDDTAWQRFRSEPWFVPALLLAIALLLVLTAYLLGIAFAAHLNATANASSAAPVGYLDPRS